MTHATTSPDTGVRPGLLERLASAPISWGVCEVPGWGLELPVDRVLREYLFGLEAD